MKIFRADPFRGHHVGDEKIDLIDSLFVKRERQKPNFNRRMFDEDFASLFRSMNRHDANLFEIVSNDDELVQKLVSNVRMRYRPHSVGETIRKLVGEIARSLVWFGRAYYFLYDDTEQEEVHVGSFSSDGLVRIFGAYVQWVPKRREWNPDRGDEDLPREIRILDATKVIRFDMPKSIKRILAAQNKILATLDKHQFGLTNFQPKATHENPNPINHFDFRVWQNTQERALYRATLGTGWNGRKYDSSKRSDFFDCHRLIRFRRNQLLLRDDILNQLGVELSRVGKRYNAEFAVEISGTDELSSIEHLDELELRLECEEVGFKEIIDYCYQRP